MQQNRGEFVIYFNNSDTETEKHRCCAKIETLAHARNQASFVVGGTRDLSEMGNSCLHSKTKASGPNILAAPNQIQVCTARGTLPLHLM